MSCPKAGSSWWFYGVILGAICLVLISPMRLHAETAEVVTWWYGPEDVAALERIINEFEAKGDRWQRTEIRDDISAQTYVMARIIAGEPPVAAQWIDGASLQRLMTAKMLRPITEPEWPRILPPLVLRTLSAPGGYVGVPVGFRSRNWIWLNLGLFKQAGIVLDADWPRSWADVNAVARQLRDAGITPIAIGGEPWQHLLTLEMVVAGIGGLDFYRRAMIDLDDAALASPVMVAAFEELRTLSEFAVLGTPTDDPGQPVAMLARGEIAMDIMGDWQKVTLERAGLVLGRDFDCIPVPGTRDFSIVNIEMFVFPDNKADGALAQQQLLADIVVDSGSQRQLNKTRGMTPVRIDMAPDGFDKCTSHLMANIRRPDGLSVGSVRSMPRSLGDLAGSAVSTFLTSQLTPEEGAILFRRTVSANR